MSIAGQSAWQIIESGLYQLILKACPPAIGGDSSSGVLAVHPEYTVYFRERGFPPTVFEKADATIQQRSAPPQRAAVAPPAKDEES